MSTDTPRPDLTPQQRASLERGLAQSAAGEVYDLGSFAEYADTPTPAFECRECDYASDEAGDTHTHPTPERVTLTDEERAMGRPMFMGETQVGLAFTDHDVERILAAREQALREEIRADLLTDEAVAGLTRVANDADRDYSAMEWSADAGRTDSEPGDWFAFITKRVATAAAARIVRGGAR